MPIASESLRPRSRYQNDFHRKTTTETISPQVSAGRATLGFPAQSWGESFNTGAVLGGRNVERETRADG